MRGCCAAALLGALAGSAAAQPEIVDARGRRWTHEPGEGVEVFVGPDGARIELSPTSLPCAQQLRLSEVPRPTWVSAAYGPVLELSGATMILCLESASGPIAVTARAAAGQDLVELGEPLAQIAELISPMVATPSLPPVAVSLPVVAVDEGQTPEPLQPLRPRPRRKTVAMGGLYAGAMTFGPPEPGGARRYGGLLGAHLRGGTREGFGLATALAVELGAGAGEPIGELRAGAGLSAGVGGVVFDLMAGGAVGSIGPAAAVDVFGEVGVLIPAGRSLTSLSVMRAIGVGGLGHDRVQLWFLPTEATFLFGARYLDYGDTGGDAFLLTLGLGFSGPRTSTPPVP